MKEKGDETMIDIKEAVRIAQESFSNLFEGSSHGEILLEEAELVEDGAFWVVSLSTEWHASSGTASLGPGSRICKFLKIEAESGRVVSMKKETM